jgi:hypothetical protein
VRNGIARIDLQGGVQAAARLVQPSARTICRSEIHQHVKMRWHERACAFMELDGSRQIACLGTYAGEYHQGVWLGAEALQHCVCKFRSFAPRASLHRLHGALDELDRKIWRRHD